MVVLPLIAKFAFTLTFPRLFPRRLPIVVFPVIETLELNDIVLLEALYVWFVVFIVLKLLIWDCIDDVTPLKYPNSAFFMEVPLFKIRLLPRSKLPTIVVLPLIAKFAFTFTLPRGLPNTFPIVVFPETIILPPNVVVFVEEL